MKRRFFICSVGRPGDGYDEENLNRCIENSGHFMHRNTQHKGVFDEVSKNDVAILKYNDKLVAYGLVNRTDSSDNVELKDWNYAIYVDRWFFFDEQQKERGINRNGVQEAVVNGDQYATIKEINPEFALKKIEDIKKDSELFKTLKQEFEMGANVKDIYNLLKANHNLILTGAPGTGKTYLAKKIAESMGCFENEIGFVQFHPSYDYTDFVEGLRPLNDDNGNVGFELKNGVFKDFCAKALKNYLDSSKQETEIEDDKMFEKVYSSLLNDIEDEIISKYPTQKGDCDVYLSKTNQIVFNTKSELGRKKYVKEDYLKALFNDVKDENIDLLNISREQLDERVAKTTDIKHVDYIQYRWTLHCLVEKYKKLKNDASENKIQKIELRPFVFIIDEINRGEINKIFGELFFSIDPGYRGEKGRVQTQYQNMVEEGDLFKKGFFVPQNVYIIGTMNDIDRSVESMDFAFRRRFAFKEVTAEESQGMLDSVEAWGKDENENSLKPDDKIVGEIKEKMDNLNKAIWHKPIDGESDEDKSIEGLSSAYHIGASYFLKLKNYKNDDGSFDFDKLWEYHLEGLLFEYLRGVTELTKKLKKLAEAYGYTKVSKYE